MCVALVLLLTKGQSTKSLTGFLHGVHISPVHAVFAIILGSIDICIHAHLVKPASKQTQQQCQSYHTTSSLNPFLSKQILST